jgi:isocitrate lyase
LSDRELRSACQWLEAAGVMTAIESLAAQYRGNERLPDKAFEALEEQFSDAWLAAAQLKTYGEAVADEMTARLAGGERFAMTVAEWRQFAKRASLADARAAAQSLAADVPWDCELPKTPDGYYQVAGGLEYAIAKSLAVAPFADLIWMETKTADLSVARAFAQAIHSAYPEMMLAYNLSPSFSWDTTGMTDEQMRCFPDELGRLGFVFNFITYGGHQIDGLASEEFAAALRQDGMLALARLQRRLRLLDSPYRTPQTLVGGPRLDAALAASSGRTAATKAMAKGSTQFQHLIETEAPPRLLEEWLGLWQPEPDRHGPWRVQLRPRTASGDLLELTVRASGAAPAARIVFTAVHGGRSRPILVVAEEDMVDEFRSTPLMTLAQLFLIHRFKAGSFCYLEPRESVVAQAAMLQELGLCSPWHGEVGRSGIVDFDESSVARSVTADGIRRVLARTRRDPSGQPVRWNVLDGTLPAISVK